MVVVVMVVVAVVVSPAGTEITAVGNLFSYPGIRTKRHPFMKSIDAKRQHTEKPFCNPTASG